MVDYAETFCTARRSFGDEKAPLDLFLRPSPNGDLLQFFVIRNGGFAAAEHVPVTVGFGERAVKGTALLYGGRQNGRRTVLINVANDALADFPKARTVTLRGSGVDYAFAVPGLDKVMAALATCNEDLRSHWNMTEERKAAIATRARSITPLRDVITYEDYPAQALREEDTGQARVMLLVDESGKVADCLLEKTSGNASLDAMTCVAFVKRARFHPAADAAGKPMKDVTHQTVSWRISG